MLRLLVPVILALLGTGGGIAAAMFLMPGEPADDAHAAEDAPSEAAADEHAALEGAAAPCGPVEPAAAEARAAADDHGASGADAATEYFKINNQFVIPMVAGGRVEALVVASISLEITAGTQAQVFAVEPRLRDAFLQVLFDHSNLGGFEGVFTSAANMRALRSALRTEAQRIIGPDVHGVLITDLVRQDTPS